MILGRGLGTRMQAADPGAALDPEQARAAAAGVKTMMPLAYGRPFLDWVLSALADSGIREVCLVIGPEHDAVRRYYSALTLTRIRITTAVQERALGTADAVLAAESFAAGQTLL
ncbi:MAG: sugar phosphate nucleotidyltransferase, partial [Gemmatimonadaceae bacterium]